MADTLATYYVRIAPSAKGMGGSLIEELTGAGEEGGKQSGNKFLGMFKGVVTAAAVGKIITQSLEAGGQLEQTLGGVQKIFGDAWTQVQENAAAAFSTAGLSANDYMQTVTGFSARLLQGLEGDTQAAVGYADMAIRDMADNANTFGTSMDSIQAAYQGFAKGNFTMLDNLKLGYGGTTAEMVRLLNDTQTTVNGTKVTMENLNQVSFDQIITAIHSVQENMEITGTTSKEAAGTLEGSAASMKAAWENLLGYISTGSPLAAGAVEDMASSIMAWLGNVGRMVGNIVQALPGILVQIVQKIIENIPAIIGAGFKLFVGLGQGIVKAIPELLKTVGSLATRLLSSLWEGLKDIGKAGGNLVQGLWEGISGKAQWVLDKIKGFGKGILNGLKSFFGIKSPSKVMRDEIGRYLAEGVGVGFEKYMPEDQINNALYNTFDDVKQTMGTFDADLAVNAAYATNGVASGGFASTNYGGVAINVYATDGQNARSIANEVMDILQRDINRNRAVYE